MVHREPESGRSGRAALTGTGGSPGFPTTHWSMLDAVRGSMTVQQRATLNCLIVRYWKPVYAFVQRCGYQADAEDLTQDFFVHALAKELFGRADQARGRFRSFLLTCVKNYLCDVEEYRRRRRVVEGVVSIHDLASRETPLAFPDGETPEAAFCRTWVRELLDRVFHALEQDFKARGMEVHCELFRRRVFEPALDGSDPSPLEELAAETGLTSKQVSNRVVTALRDFQHRMRDEIRIYAGSEEEVDAEIVELFRFAARY